MNSLAITGNLGKDAVVREAGNSKVCSFGVAIKSGYGDREQTIWIDCSLFGKRAEGGLVQYLVKGQTVAIQGEMGTREYNGKTYVTCNVAQITLVGSKPSNDSQQSFEKMPQPKPQDFTNAADDVPF